MKLPFPYALAAEFILFQSARKVTLPHLAVGLSFTIGASVAQLVTIEVTALWLAVVSSLVVGFAVSASTFWLFRQVLRSLEKLVEWELISPPDKGRLDEKVRSYLGEKVTLEKIMLQQRGASRVKRSTREEQ